MATDIIDKGLQSQHAVVQEGPVKVVPKPLLGGQGQAEMGEIATQLKIIIYLLLEGASF